MNFPVERTLIEVSKIKNSNRTLKVLQYNVLNPKNLYRIKYPWASKECLKWSYRRDNFLKEIQSANPDIFTMQEVSFFTEFWKPEFSKLGYQGFYKEQKNSGIAIFMKNELKDFELKVLEQHEIDYNDLHDLLDKDVQIDKFKMNNVALVVVVQYIHKETKEELNLIVATTHLYWDALYYFVRMLQVAKLVDFLSQLKYDFTCILAGDFNFTPDDLEYSYISGKLSLKEISELQIPEIQQIQINELKPDFFTNHSKLIESVGKIISTMKVQKFESSHCDYTTIVKSNHRNMELYSGEPAYTVSAGICLDYIFFTGDQLKVRNILTIPDEESFGEGTPNDKFSSDHFSIMAEFEF
jgi:mRNA deadenylase 3'-5' endonuclease subunit Ccr4